MTSFYFRDACPVFGPHWGNTEEHTGPTYDLFSKGRSLLDPVIVLLCRVQNELMKVKTEDDITPELITVMTQSGTTDLSGYLRYTESSVILRDYVLHVLAFGGVRLSDCVFRGIIATVNCPVRLSVVLYQNRKLDPMGSDFDNKKTKFTLLLGRENRSKFLSIARMLYLVIASGNAIDDVPEFTHPKIVHLDTHQILIDRNGYYYSMVWSDVPVPGYASYNRFVACVSYIKHLIREELVRGRS